MFSDRIKQLVRSNPGQCSVNEYEMISQTILSKGPCNLLIFGLGNDSQLWLDVNKGGKTVFLENHEPWINKVKGVVGDHLDVRKVTYTTEIQEWEAIIDDVDRLNLPLDMDILSTKWDIIFIDSPMGCGVSGVPGRMQSIYTGSKLDCNEYFLHDVNRPVEKTYGAKYFGTPTNSVDRLNYWRT